MKYLNINLILYRRLKDIEELTVYEWTELNQEVEKEMEEINKRIENNIKAFIKTLKNNN